MKTNSAYTIQQQEILKILGNSELDIDTEMEKIFNSDKVSEKDHTSKAETMVRVTCLFE